MLGRSKSTICRELARNDDDYLPNPRHKKGHKDNRGKIPISHELSERTVEANERSRLGDWEADTIVGLLHTITSDRVREFQLHGNNLTDEDLQAVVDQLNQRPRKCLGYRTPQEVYFSETLHLA